MGTWYDSVVEITGLTPPTGVFHDAADATSTEYFTYVYAVYYWWNSALYRAFMRVNLPVSTAVTFPLGFVVYVAGGAGAGVGNEEEAPAILDPRAPYPWGGLTEWGQRARAAGWLAAGRALVQPPLNATGRTQAPMVTMNYNNPGMIAKVDGTAWPARDVTTGAIIPDPDDPTAALYLQSDGNPALRVTPSNDMGDDYCGAM